MIESLADYLESRKTSNVLVASFKDCISDAGGDPWGSALSWGFAACDWATDHGVPVPSSLEYRQALGGSDTDSWEYQGIDSLATGEDLVFPALGINAICAAMPHALKVLERYLSLCKLNGLDY